jgi:hypothetical protein
MDRASSLQERQKGIGRAAADALAEDAWSVQEFGGQ